jgi:hypothetical protein
MDNRRIDLPEGGYLTATVEEVLISDPFPASPVPKVWAAGAGAALGNASAKIVVHLLIANGIEVPAGVVDAIEVIFSAGAAFIAGYIAPPRI